MISCHIFLPVAPQPWPGRAPARREEGSRAGGRWKCISAQWDSLYSPWDPSENPQSRSARRGGGCDLSPASLKESWGALGDGMIHMLINERDGAGFSWGKIRHADRSQGGCHGSVAVAPQAKLNHSYTRPTIYSSSHTSKSHACHKPKVVRLGWMNELWEDLLQDAVLDCLFCLAGQTKITLYLMNLNSWNFGKDLHSNEKQFP